jgi:hypothetical protein
MSKLTGLIVLLAACGGPGHGAFSGGAERLIYSVVRGANGTCFAAHGSPGAQSQPIACPPELISFLPAKSWLEPDVRLDADGRCVQDDGPTSCPDDLHPDDQPSRLDVFRTGDTCRRSLDCEAASVGEPCPHGETAIACP